MSVRFYPQNTVLSQRFQRRICAHLSTPTALPKAFALQYSLNWVQQAANTDAFCQFAARHTPERYQHWSLVIFHWVSRFSGFKAVEISRKIHQESKHTLAVLRWLFNTLESRRGAEHDQSYSTLHAASQSCLWRQKSLESVDLLPNLKRHISGAWWGHCLS